MTKVRSLILGLLFAVLMIEVIIIAPREIGVSAKPDSTLLEDLNGETSSQTMRGVHLVEAKDSSREWELWADQAFTQKNGAEWQLENVKVTFFGENNVTFTVTGNKGQVQVNTKDVEISGNVKMASSNGYHFETEHLFYTALDRTIKTDDPVRMYGNQGRREEFTELSGIGLRASLVENDIHIVKNVRSKKTLTTGENVIIEAESAQFSGANKFAQYKGEVTIDYKGSRITGPSARFDYDSNVKAVTSLLVEGGARVTDLTKWATAKTIEMLFRENKFILKGGPRVVQDNDELVGEEIVFLDGGREIIVNKAKAEFTPRMEK